MVCNDLCICNVNFNLSNVFLIYIYIFKHFSLESNSEVANRVNAEIVTKAETAAIWELLSYMKQEEAKV